MHASFCTDSKPILAKRKFNGATPLPFYGLSDGIFHVELNFDITFSHRVGGKWQSKTLFLAIFYPGSSIVKSVLDYHRPGVIL